MFTAFVKISVESKSLLMDERLPSLYLELLQMCRETFDLVMVLP